jgi:hypothetical protein
MPGEHINAYFKALDKIWLTGVAREHSHRPALAHLLEKELRGLVIVNEPAQVQCGAPDFVVLRDNIPIGHVEAKDLGVPLDEVAQSEQLQRYRAGLPNLLLTNYIDFVWFVEGTLRRRVTIAKKAKANTPLVRSPDMYADLEALFTEFAAKVAPQITTAADLAHRLANVAILIRSSVALRLRLTAQVCCMSS